MRLYKLLLFFVAIVAFSAGACKAMSLPVTRKTPTPIPQPTALPSATPRPTRTPIVVTPGTETPQASTCPLLPSAETSQAVGALKGSPAELPADASIRGQEDVFGRTCTLSTQAGAQYQVLYRAPEYWFLYIPDEMMIRQRLLNARTVEGIGERAYVDEGENGEFTLIVIDKTQGVMRVEVTGGQLEQAEALAQVALDHVASK